MLEEIQLLEASEIANKQIFDRVREINTQQQDQIENLEAIEEKTREIAALEEDVADQERRLAGVSQAESDQIKRKEQIIRLQEELNKLEVEGQEEKKQKATRN